MDLNHGMPFAMPVKIYQGFYEDSRDSDIVIISAGANQKRAKQGSILYIRILKFLNALFPKIVKYNSPDETIILVVTNLSILTYVVSKISVACRESYRFGHRIGYRQVSLLIGEHVGVDTRNIHGYIIGGTVIPNCPYGHYSNSRNKDGEILRNVPMLYRRPKTQGNIQ